MFVFYFRLVSYEICLSLAVLNIALYLFKVFVTFFKKNLRNKKLMLSAIAFSYLE